MIYFASRTGNVRTIVNRLALPNTEIQVGAHVSEPFLLFTYTDGIGNVPELVKAFMSQNHKHCKGIIGSGNSNFGINNFCGAADKLSRHYGIPIVRKIEMRGFSGDDEAIKIYYEQVINSEKISAVK